MYGVGMSLRDISAHIKDNQEREKQISIMTL